MILRDTRDPNPAIRAQKFKQISDVAARLAVVLLIAALAISNVVLVMRQSSNSTKTDTTLQNTQELKRALHILIDCTTVGHPCNERGQKATANAVSQLGRISVLASSCAATLPNPTPGNVERCVLAHLR
jgi:hypothetical protein